MKTILILIPLFLFQGCLYFNDRGVSGRYYNDCKEYYDGMGIYHKDCDENIIDYNTITNIGKKKSDASDTTSQSQSE